MANKTNVQIWVLLLVAVIGLAAFKTSRGVPILDSIAVSYAFIILFHWLLTIPHELGHAIAARIFGHKDVRIVLGTGRPIGSTTAFGFKWLFNRIPFGGFTIHLDPVPLARWQEVVIYAAGCLVSVAFIVVTWIAFPPVGYFPSFHNFSGLFLWANLILVVHNLFPSHFILQQGRFASDGMLILQTLFPRAAKSLENSREWKFRPSFERTLNTALAAFATVGLLIVVGLLAFLPPRHDWKVISITAGLFCLALWTARLTWRTARSPVAPAQKTESAHLAGIHELIGNSPMSGSPWISEFYKSYLAEKLDDCSRLTDDTLRKHPNDPFLLYASAVSSHAKGDSQRALDTLACANTGSLSDVARHALTLTRILFLVTSDSQAASDYTFQYVASEIPLRLKSEAIDALVSYHLYYGKLDQLDQLLTWISQAVAEDPENIELQSTLGGVLGAQGKYAEAEPIILKALDHSSLHNQAVRLYFLAQVRAGQGNHAEARKLLDQAQILPHEPWFKRRIAELLSSFPK